VGNAYLALLQVVSAVAVCVQEEGAWKNTND
jgi:hypothetical protein